MPASARAALLYRIADAIEARLDEFAAAESADQGKPVSVARSVDIPRACLNFRFFAGAILHHSDRASHMNTGADIAVSWSQNVPVGVCGLIAPWNLPLYLLTWKIAPAIAVGNTCVCKPSEFTSLTAFLLCDVMDKVGLPKGVVNMVFGTGPNVGAVLASSPQVPLISFTGSTLTGERIATAAAPFHKKLSLELGGKNANIIFDDADLDRCVPVSIRSSFANQGEICLCGSRILVQSGIYDQFVARFVAAAKALVVGDPRDAKTTMGPLVSQVHFDKVMSYIALAREEGGEIVAGGERVGTRGFFVQPTVVTNMTKHHRCMQEEIFGPVVTIAKFDTEAEAIDIANSVQYGLAASLWSTNVDRCHRVSTQLDAGTIWVNCWMLRDLQMPFGGLKASGVGREGGEYSIDFYTEQKTICMRYAP